MAKGSRVNALREECARLREALVREEQASSFANANKTQMEKFLGATRAERDYLREKVKLLSAPPTRRVARVHFVEGSNAASPRGWRYAVPAGLTVGLGDVVRVRRADGVLRRAYVIGTDVESDNAQREPHAAIVEVLLSAAERRRVSRVPGSETRARHYAANAWDDF